MSEDDVDELAGSALNQQICIEVLGWKLGQCGGLGVREWDKPGSE